METNTALEFVDVCKRFPNMEAYSVDHVNLKINDGEIITIVGRSGSGKTTLMKMVNVLYDISYGDILFFGKSIKDLDPIAHRRSIGYVVQQSGLFPHMTVEKNIALIPNLLKWEKDKIDESIDRLLHLVDLDPKTYRKRYPRQLSGGQQQRVGIARALASDPSVLLMDEPFGAIDMVTREALQNELLRIQKETKKTILFVTHDINEAIKLGDRVLIMDNGCVQQFDTPTNIILHPANEFVSKLIGTDDKSAKLQLLTAKTIMSPLEGGEILRIDDLVVDKEDSIQKIIPEFVKNEGNTVYVADGVDIIGTVKHESFLHLVETL